MVEIEAVHLGADQVKVHLLGDRPGLGVDRAEPRLELRQALPLLLHGRGGVVGDAVGDLRLLECAPLPEKRNQIVVARGALGRHLLHRPPTAARRENDGARQNEQSPLAHEEPTARMISRVDGDEPEPDSHFPRHSIEMVTLLTP